MRQTREIGSDLILGDICYRLDAVVGQGSSAIVYRASYHDSLNRDILHQVLIKELFPASDGSIYRTASGHVASTEKGNAIMEQAERRFLIGNRINLQLLQKNPAHISGNLNSFAAWGSFYSVLSVHGGEDLLQLLGKRSFNIREAAGIMIKLLQALDIFHQNRLLHLDISPDNILLLPEQVLLIDFNSVWELDNPNPTEFTFSKKAGYSPPEVLLQDFGSIGFATDLYAACAVFFHMLSGRRLKEEELLHGGLKKMLPDRLSCLKEIPQTAAIQLLRILSKGLHPLSRMRYQTASELEEALTELVDRLNGCGVTHSALWEVSAAAQKQQQPKGPAYLPQPVSCRGKTLQFEQLCSQLSTGNNYLLTGGGGLGKTRLLQEIWKQGCKRYQPRSPVFLYISLRDYQESGQEAFFLRRMILRALHFSPEHHLYHDALHQLEKILDTACETVSVVLLLDGLNEAGMQREKLLIEIENLGHRPGTAILITDRSEEVLGYGLAEFQPLSLSPLSSEQVAEQLENCHLPVPAAPELAQLLTNPMMLFLYLDTVQTTSEDGKSTPPQSQEQLIALYLDAFCKKAMRSDSGALNRQLCSEYLLRYLLPEIAWQLSRRKKTLLSFTALCRIADSSYQILRNGKFGNAFPSYRGKSRIMFEGISSAEEWYDFAVNNQLIERFGLLVSTPDGYFGLVHDNFQQALAVQAKQNHLQIRKSRLAGWKRMAAGILAVLILGSGGMLTAHTLTRRTEFTQQENARIYDAIAALNTSLGCWSGQISSQLELLERASISDILDNQDPGVRKNLADMIEQKQQLMETLYASPLDQTLAEELLETKQDKPLFSVEILGILCSRYQTTGQQATEGMTQLSAYLCDDKSIYDTRDKREQLVSAYYTVLQAEIRYISYLLALLMDGMTPQQQSQVTQAITYMPAFDSYYDGPGSVESQYLEDGLHRAEQALTDAQREMTAQGFQITWGELPDIQSEQPS